MRIYQFFEFVLKLVWKFFQKSRIRSESFIQILFIVLYGRSEL